MLLSMTAQYWATWCLKMMSVAFFKLEAGRPWLVMGWPFPSTPSTRTSLTRCCWSTERTETWRDLAGDILQPVCIGMTSTACCRYWLHGVCKPNMQEKRASEPLSIDQVGTVRGWAGTRLNIICSSCLPSCSWYLALSALSSCSFVSMSMSATYGQLSLALKRKEAFQRSQTVSPY